jgi:hypothetical protein
MSHVDEGALHAYLDGELPPAERARLEAHVAECPACRTRLLEERALVERAGQLLGLAQPVERPAPPLHQLRRPRLVWRLRVPLAWAASLLMAVGLGYYLGEASYAPASRQVAALQSTGDSLGWASRTDGYRVDQLQRFQERPAPVDSRPSRQAAEPADRAAANTRPESVGLVAGVVASEAQPVLRAVTPTRVPSTAIATAPPEAALSAERGRLVATEWPIIRAGPARELLGADPVGVPGLAVRNMRRSPTGEVVLVEQTLDSATVIQIFQERAEDDRLGFLYRERSAAPRSAAPAAPPRLARAATERLARYIGGLRVEITGPLSTDSLNRLLEQVKPIKP